VTVSGGVASIATGMGVTLFITIANSVMSSLYGTQLLNEQYIILPAASASILTLIIVSLATKPDPESKWGRFYTKETSLAKAMDEVKG
jgi:solute:Na+ symporter, SSS family